MKLQERQECSLFTHCHMHVIIKPYRALLPLLQTSSCWLSCNRHGVQLCLIKTRLHHASDSGLPVLVWATNTKRSVLAIQLVQMYARVRSCLCYTLHPLSIVVIMPDSLWAANWSASDSLSLVLLSRCLMNSFSSRKERTVLVVSL